MAGCTGHGLRGDAGHGMGMAHSYGFHPVCGNEHGRAMFLNAH